MYVKTYITKKNQHRLRPTHLPLAPGHDEFELLGINEMSCIKGDIMLPGVIRGKSSFKKVLTSFLELFGVFFQDSLPLEFFNLGKLQ